MADPVGTVNIERPAEHVLSVVIDRPERSNALTASLASALRDAISAADDDPWVHVIMLRGAGDRAFCGGYDLGSVGRGVRDDSLQALLATVRSTKVPTLALVNGHAVGAGFDLACSCDLRVVRREAKVGLPAIKLGVAYDHTGLRRILDIVPAARRLLLTGELVLADELPGFADLIVDEADVEKCALELASEMANGSPAALAYMVAAIRPGQGGLSTQVAQRWRYQILDGPDSDEAMAAKEAGRLPIFPPRRVT